MWDGMNHAAIDAALELLSDELPLIGMFAWFKGKKMADGVYPLIIVTKLDAMTVLDEGDVANALAVVGQAIRDDYASFLKKEGMSD